MAKEKNSERINLLSENWQQELVEAQDKVRVLADLVETLEAKTGALVNALNETTKAAQKAHATLLSIQK